MNKENFSRALIGLLATFIIGVGILYVSTILVRKFDFSIGPERIVEKIVKPPECQRNLEAFQLLIKDKQVVRLIENMRMYAANGKLINAQDITIARSGQGEIACGYVYIRARKNGSALEEKYESIYMNPQEFGGHLLNRRSIELPVSEKITELLLPLNSISYLPDSPYNPDAQNYQVSNWVKLLNVSNEIKFHIGLSAADPRGIIEQISIAYKCWNPDTGEETQDCQLSIKK